MLATGNQWVFFKGAQKSKQSPSRSITVFLNEQSYKIPGRRERQLSQLKKEKG